MMECTDIFWHHFYKGAGVMVGAMLLAVLRQQYRHEEALQEARTREYQVRDAHYRVVQGGQG